MSESGRVTSVLIPGVCHPIAAETLGRLRQAAGDSLRIVGVDLEERGHDYEEVDAFHFVPPATSPKFIPALLEICERHGVDLVVPWSDLEVEAISTHAAEFRAAGVATLCGSAESVQRALDKGTTLEDLERHGIPVPAYALAASADEVERAAAELGYPERSVVVKARRSSGGRGLWILEEGAEMLRHGRGPGRTATLGAFLSIMRESERSGRDVPDFVVTEFLEGDDYSVDALAREGEAVYVVPRRRLVVTEGISRIGEVVPNAEVRTLVARVIRAMGLHLNVNVQLKYTAGAGGEPRVYEVNPRVSGSIVANDGAGVSLFFYGIALALGRPIPAAGEIQLRRTRMFRRWVGRYSQTDEHFTP
ncbi:MAG: ATP-grasp domain-containing protein [Candidatus Krumholzibacteria bacterium]|nr:ATP-grasp domain-containing protein [Candidatus Krumholzibacteria bacterium]